MSDKQIDEAFEALKVVDDAQDIPQGVEVGEVFFKEFRTIRRVLEQQRSSSITERQLQGAINILSIDTELDRPDYRIARDIFTAASTLLDK